MLGHMGQEQLALACVGFRQHLPIVAQPLGFGQAMHGLPIGLPAGRVAAAEPVHQFLGLGQGELVGADFQVQKYQVHIEEEVQVDVHDVQVDGRIALAQRHARAANIMAAEHPHGRTRCLVGVRPRGPAFPVQELLHIGQEGHEFVVMPLVELVRRAGVFVHHFAPWRCVAHLLQ